MRDQAKEGFDFLVNERGYTPAAAAGILGNLAAESGFRTNARNPGDGRDGSDSIGIAQWNSDRAVGLGRFARANGYDPRTLRTQLAYVDWELNNTHQGAMQGLRDARTPEEAAAAFVTRFEKPKGSDRGAQYSHGWQDRLGHSNAIFGAFGRGGASAGGGLAQPTSANVPAQATGRSSAPMVELLDDTADMPVQGGQDAGFFIPPGPGGSAVPTMAGQGAPMVELLDDEPAPRLAPSQGGTPASPNAPRSRVRVSLPAVDNDPERASRIAAYERQAKADRAGQNPVAAVADTAVRGLARAVPFMDDIAAAGDYYLLGEGKSYQDALDRQRARNRVDDEQSPVTSYGTQIAGGLALPGGALASSGLRGAAAVGAGYGALYGVGQGDGVGDRASRAVTGGALGGALGVGGSAALTGLGAAGRFAADRATGITSVARGAMDAEGEAARRIAAAQARDARLPAAQDDAATFALARQNGQPVMALDEGGETVRALARSSANTSPEGRFALDTAISARNAGQAERVSDFIAGVTRASRDSTQTLESLQAAARQANRPAYARAYAEGAGGLWDDGLQALTAAPAVQQAIAKASRTGANRAVADGFTPPVSPFARNADGTYALRQTAGGEVAYPSLQFWDHVKRNLDDAYTVAQRQGRNSEAADIDSLRRNLISQLDEAAPSYAKARAGAAAAFGAQDALEAGAKFVGTKMAGPDARRAVAKLSEPERKLFQEGYTNALLERIRSLPDRRDVVNSIFASPRAREEIQIALGPQAASRLEAFLRVENVMTMAGRAVQGNSTTARQLAEMGLAGGAGAAGGYVFGDGSATSVGFGAILGNLARKGAIKVDARVAQKVGEMLSSTDPATIRKATEQVARQPALMKLVRQAEEALSSALPRVAQPEAPALPILGGPRAAGASDGEREPPRQ